MPAIGDAGIYPVTMKVTDDGLPNLSHDELINITIEPLDSDGDGLSNYDEIYTHLTDPSNPDSDNDGFDDGTEINYGSDPNDFNSWPDYADGDLAPLGNPDGLINAADLLIMQRIVLGQLIPTSLEFVHGDLYPASTPDGVIDVSDLLLLQHLVIQ